MSMLNDIEWTRKGNEENCTSNSGKVKMYAKKCSQGHWTFLGPGDEKKGSGNCHYKPEGKWDSGHPVFTSASALSRGILRKIKGKETIHFNADASNTELIFRIIHSVNQLSMYGAVSNWCEEFGLRPNERGPTSEKFTKENSVSKEILKERECTSSELFDIRSKDTNSIGQPMEKKSSVLRITV